MFCGLDCSCLKRLGLVNTPCQVYYQNCCMAANCIWFTGYKNVIILLFINQNFHITILIYIEPITFNFKLRFSMHQTEEEFNETDEQKKTFLQKLSDAKDALKYMFYHVNKNYGDPYFDYKTSSGKTIKCPNLRAHMICGFSCPDWSK